MRTKLVTALISLTAALVAPQVASAKDICVMSVSTCPAADTYTPSGTGLQAALDAAASSPGADRVLAGDGKFTAPTSSGFQYTDKSAPVEIAGAGSDKTLLDAPTDASYTLFLRGGAGSSVHDLGIQVPLATQPNIWPVGLDLLYASADHLAVTSDPANPRGTGVAIADGSLANGSIEVANTYMDGVHANENATLSDTSISGYEGVYVGGAHLRARRLTIKGATGVFAQATDAVVEDSVIQSTSATNSGVSLAVFYNGTVNLTLRHDTIVAPQSGGLLGVYAHVDAGGDGTVTVSNSVIQGFAHNRYSWAQNGSTAALNSDHSSYDPAGDVVKTSNGGVATMSPAGANGDVNVAPGFADPANGDYHLTPGSALIDAGDPAGLGAGEPTSDRDGAPRLLDGNGDCAVRLDIGAFEYRPAQPVVKASATGAPIAGGAPAQFSAAGSCASDPSDSLAYDWSFDDGSSATGSEVSHAFTTAGVHNATLTVSDGSGHSASAPVSIDVAPAPVPVPVPGGGSQGGPGPAPQPKVTKVAVLPHRFRSRRSTTARVRFVVDRKARVRISIVRRHRKPLARTVNAARGKSVVRLTRERLARGNYRVVVRVVGAQSSAVARFAVTR